MDHSHGGSCPGSRTEDFRSKDEAGSDDAGKPEGGGLASDSQSHKRASQLKQWPIQLHLISPMAPYYQKADVLLSADCVAYAAGDFHKEYLKGKSIAIGCPKLDEGQEVYSEKVQSLIDDAKDQHSYRNDYAGPLLCRVGGHSSGRRRQSQEEDSHKVNRLKSPGRGAF